MKYEVTAAEPQQDKGKGKLQKFRCKDVETGIDYPHIVQIWNHEVKAGDILDGDIQEKTSNYDGKQYINHQFKKAGGGFGGRGYNGPTAEQFARGQAALIVAPMGIDDPVKKKKVTDGIINYILNG